MPFNSERQIILCDQAIAELPARARHRCPRLNGALHAAAERLAAEELPARASVVTGRQSAFLAFLVACWQTTNPKQIPLLAQHWRRQVAKLPRPAFRAQQGNRPFVALS